jgi:hypothetical protein
MWEETVVIYPKFCLLTLRKTTNIIALEFVFQSDLNLDPPEKEVRVLPRLKLFVASALNEYSDIFN